MPDPVANRVAESRDVDPVSFRRLKKREVDRRCQRKAREKTKSRIAYLEKLVEDLKNQDVSGRIEKLTAQLSTVEREKQELANKLTAIQKISASFRPSLQVEESPFHITNSIFTEDSRLDNRSGEYGVGGEKLFSPSMPPIAPVTPTASFDQEMISSHEHLIQPIAVPPLDLGHLKDHCSVINCGNESALPGKQTCECARARSETTPLVISNLWRYANETLEEHFSWRGQVDVQDSSSNEDTPIRAVIEGWDAVERTYGLSPSWRILRRIDENLFFACGKVERLAIMLTMHLLLQFHSHPTTETFAKLPRWFWARPSQTIVPAYAINYFVWPGLRERFIFFQHRYCSNTFWYLFASSLRVMWQYEFRDCYNYNTEIETFEVAPLFRKRIGNIKSWTMTSDLLNHYPELYEEIPAFGTIPRSLSNNQQIQRWRNVSEAWALFKSYDTTFGVESSQGVQDETNERCRGTNF